MNTQKLKNAAMRILSSAVKAVRYNQGAITVAGIVSLFIYYLLSGDADTTIAMSVVLTPAAVKDEPLTTLNAAEASDELLLSAIDRQVIKIRPSSTPLDQISRSAGARHAGSMKAEYYSVDSRPFTDTVTRQLNASPGIQTLRVANKSMFSPTDTILLPDIEVKDKEGNVSKGLVLYIIDIDRDGVCAIPVNNFDGGEPYHCNVPEGTKVVRMGRAATELDVQTGQYEALPKKEFNYCQIFKAQIEQSTLMKLSNKEVSWSLTDLEESAIVDMRLAMEKSFLFGSRCCLTRPDDQDRVYLTGGIWTQAGKERVYETLTAKTVIDICRDAFTGCGGSGKKILVGGSRLIAELSKVRADSSVLMQGTENRWGLTLNKITTNFGTLYVAMSEIFDQCGHAADGMIIDPEYLVKYSHIPFNTERIDLRKSGQRNTEAIVITEASCLVLRYPTAHMRLVKATL